MADKSQQGLSLAISPERAVLSVEAGSSLMSEADIQQLLAEKGVCHGIDQAAIQQGLVNLAAGKDIKNLTIASATRPTLAEPEVIEQHIANGQLAVPGDVVASKRAGLPGEDGISVLGEVIAAKPGVLVELGAGNNTLVQNDQLIATQYGLIKKAEGLLQVEPPVYVSADKLTATMDIYPVSAPGTVVTYDHVTAALTYNKIIEGIDQDAILAALEEAEEEHEVQRQVTVACGVAPVAPISADVEFYFSVNNLEVKDFLESFKESGSIDEAAPITHLTLVKEGDVVAKELTGQPGIPGKSVFGEIIAPAKSKQAGHKAPGCGSNVEKDPETLEYKVTVFHAGYVSFEPKKISVIDPIALSEDHMRATLTVYAPSVVNGSSDQLTEQDILKKLSSLGVNYGIDKETIQKTLEQVYETAVPVVERDIATGNPGERGSDAFLDYMLSVEKAVGKLHDDGSIDFKERGTIINVNNGAAICTRIPPTPGQPAITVTGETIPANSGVDIDFRAGEHCCIKDNIFYATDAGAVFVKDNVVHVTEIFQVSGDVDLNTGNLFQKKGCIEIGGNVQSGFEVKANGHIIVKNNVENGRLIAGGNININGGVVQPESGEGYVHSVGDVAVKFAQNAKIYCYSNIEIGNSSMSSQLHAKASIIATKGKGCIIGGIVKAGKSIRVKALGSPAAAITHAEIEVDPKTRKHYIEAIAVAEEAAKTDPAQKVNLAKLLKEQREIHEACREQAEIIVEDTVYPGVTIKILDVVKKISEEIRRCRITLAANNRIKISKLE